MLNGDNVENVLKNVENCVNAMLASVQKRAV